MSMFLLEGSGHRSCNLASECTHVTKLHAVSRTHIEMHALMCLGVQKPLPPEPLGHALAMVPRPSKPTMTTLPRKTYGFNSARCYCQNPLEYALATVSRPPKPKVTTFPQNPRVQKRAPLPPQPSRARPCQGCQAFATLEAKSDDLSAKSTGPKPRAATARAL